MLGDAGQLIDADDVQGFAYAIERVFADHAFAAACAAKGLERARQYRWDRAAQQTGELYERAIARRRCVSG